MRTTRLGVTTVTRAKQATKPVAVTERQQGNYAEITGALGHPKYSKNLEKNVRHMFEKILSEICFEVYLKCHFFQFFLQKIQNKSDFFSNFSESFKQNIFFEKI